MITKEEYNSRQDKAGFIMSVGIVLAMIWAGNLDNGNSDDIELKNIFESSCEIDATKIKPLKNNDCYEP